MTPLHLLGCSLRSCCSSIGCPYSLASRSPVRSLMRVLCFVGSATHTRTHGECQAIADRLTDGRSYSGQRASRTN